MKQSEEVFTHANCGGTIQQDMQTHHYICNRCHAEAEIIISAGEQVEGKPEQVTLCDPHGQSL